MRSRRNSSLPAHRGPFSPDFATAGNDEEYEEMRLIRLSGPLLVAIVAASSACARDDGPEFSPAEVLSAPTNVGMAPNFAVSKQGTRASAWVSAPDGGTDGRLYISVGGAPAELRDSLGPIEAHGEAPPKIAYSEDGALNAL